MNNIPSNLTDEELENHYYLTGEVEKAALMRRIIELEKYKPPQNEGRNT